MTPDQQSVLILIKQINNSQFGGIDNGFLPSEIMAFVNRESSFVAHSYHRDNATHWSKGLMQVENTTAANLSYWKGIYAGFIPKTVINPTLANGWDDGLYQPTIGLTVGMNVANDYWNFLTNHLGHDPDYEMWAAAYNEGPMNALRGRQDDAYVVGWLRYQEFWASQGVDQ